MEIKKGISQMPEYPNQEINYVIPSDGKMYYVLKNGVLDDGTVIATLDPKYAFDQTLSCNTVGAFKEDGSVLVDFDKKEIKVIAPNLLFAVASNPISPEVIDAKAKEHDEALRGAIEENATIITDKLINEMGITGELLFSDAFNEANVYKTDSYNNKIGIDASFIGKTSKELYFHSNDMNADTKVVSLDSTGESNSDMEVIDSVSNDGSDAKVEDVSTVTEAPNDGNDELKLDIDQDILDGFSSNNGAVKENDDSSEINLNIAKDESVVTEASESAENSDNSSFELPSTSSVSTDGEGDQVLDNVIAVMKKMIDETNKLNERISVLEKEIAQKDKVLEEQESKKGELSSLLSQANEVLENIED